jgi:hypothetical protein
VTTTATTTKNEQTGQQPNNEMIHGPRSKLWLTVMSTLPLYMRISSFSMIYNICTTFGSIIRLGQCCRMCSEPLAIYTMSFRPFPMFYNVFMDFPMFARLYLTYCYINGLSMHSPYYSILIRHVPDLLRLCFDFIYLWRYQYSDVLVIYSFG